MVFDLIPIVLCLVGGVYFLRLAHKKKNKPDVDQKNMKIARFCGYALIVVAIYLGTIEIFWGS